MISVLRKKEILNYHIVYGYGAKKIRTEMIKAGKKPASRGVIRRFINTYDRILKTKGLKAATAYYSKEEEFHAPQRERTKLDARARQYIEDRLEDNKRKIAEGNRKQCMDLQRIWEILCEEMGYTFCYSTVTAYARQYALRQAPKKSKECYIRQYHPAGEECQFDWGDVKLKINGKAVTVRMAVFTLPHSNYRKAYLFIREHTLAFKESHRNFFHDIGRIPKRMVYDNMKVAVKAFVGTEKEPTDALLDLSSFYGFEYRFCIARSGNEKGNVEESVKVVRGEVFSVRDEFDSLQEAQEYLDKGCERLNGKGKSLATENIVRLTEEDFAAMKPWKDDIACFMLEERQVDKYGVITVEKSFYSVPDTLVGETVYVRIYTNKIEIIYNAEVVAEHDKIEKGGWHILLDHYLHTLSYKPGALKNAEALRQAPEGIRRVFSGCFLNAPKDFIELLLFAKEKGIVYNDIVDAYDSLKRSHISNIDLRLMKDKLMPQEKRSSAVIIQMNQSSEEIEQQAEKGLKTIAGIMNLQNTTYGTK